MLKPSFAHSVHLFMIAQAHLPLNGILQTLEDLILKKQVFLVGDLSFDISKLLRVYSRVYFTSHRPIIFQTFVLLFKLVCAHPSRPQ